MAVNYWRFMAQGGMGACNQLEDLLNDGVVPDSATIATLETVAKRLDDICKRARQAKPGEPNPVNQPLRRAIRPK